MEIDKLDKTYFLTTASLSKTQIGDVGELLIAKKSKKEIGHTLEAQKDLMKIIAVLVSTGMNLNDDVFLPEEILPVRDTGAHKPLNLEHDPKQIIGHMLRTYAALKDGSIVPSDETPQANEFDIIAESVLYRFLFPDLADQVRSLAKANKLFCSIECWFSQYDFLVGSKIVKRNKDTAPILDGALKMNGGKGYYDGQKVGRVLRNILIGGIGLVKVPANVESVIKSVSSLKDEVVNNVIDNDVVKTNVIGDIFELSVNSLKERKMENKEVLEEIAQVIAAQRAATEVKSEPKPENIKDKADKVIAEAQLPSEVKELLCRVQALEVSNKELKAAKDAAEQETESAKRSAIFKDLGLDDKLIVAHLSDSFFGDRKTFDKIVALVIALKDKYSPKAEIKTQDKPEAQTIAAITVTAPQPVVPVAKVEMSQIVEQKPEIKTDVKTDTKPEVQVEAPKAEIQENTQEQETEDVITLEDLELVDKEVKVETGNKPATTLTEKYADIVQSILTRNKGNEKWAKLAQKK